MSQIASRDQVRDILDATGTRPHLTARDGHGLPRFNFQIDPHQRDQLATGRSNLVLLDFPDASSLFDRAHLGTFTERDFSRMRLTEQAIENKLPIVVPNLAITNVHEKVVDALGHREHQTWRDLRASFGVDAGKTFALLRAGAQSLPVIVPRETTLVTDAYREMGPEDRRRVSPLGSRVEDLFAPWLGKEHLRHFAQVSHEERIAYDAPNRLITTHGRPSGPDPLSGARIHRWPGI